MTELPKLCSACPLQLYEKMFFFRVFIWRNNFGWVLIQKHRTLIIGSGCHNCIQSARRKHLRKNWNKKIKFYEFLNLLTKLLDLWGKISGFSQKIFKRVVKTTLYVSGEIFWEIHLQEITKRSYPDCKIQSIRRVVIIVFCINLGTIEETFSLQKMIFFWQFGQEFHETPIQDISSRLLNPYSTCLRELLEKVVPQKKSWGNEYVWIVAR